MAALPSQCAFHQCDHQPQAPGHSYHPCLQPGQPLGLCTCSSLCLECSCPDSFSAPSLVLLRSLFTSTEKPSLFTPTKVRNSFFSCLSPPSETSNQRVNRTAKYSCNFSPRPFLFACISLGETDLRLALLSLSPPPYLALSPFLAMHSMLSDYLCRTSGRRTWVRLRAVFS